MALFKSDLLRVFTIGFLLGTAALVSVLGSPFEQSIADHVIPAATAAPVLPDQTLVDPADSAQR